jgi:hypothetical protein
MTDEAEVDRRDRRKALDQFAGEPTKTDLVPAASFQAPVDRVFGAQKVAVYRNERTVLEKLQLLAAAAGSDWYYRWPVTTANGEKEWVEGPSIKLADDLVRIYGNCDLDTQVVDIGDSWVFKSRFIDLETGYSRTRLYQQRKGQRTSKKMDAQRALDIAFQIGSSKAERNVVVHALRTFADYAVDEAKNSLIDKIGKNLAGWRDRVLDGLAKEGIEKQRVEKVMGRESDAWLAPDVAKVIASMKAIAEGMATWDESYPKLDAAAEPAAEDKPETAGDLNKFAEGKPAAGTAEKTAEEKTEEPVGEKATAKAEAKTDKADGKAAGKGELPANSVQYQEYAQTLVGDATTANDLITWFRSDAQVTLRRSCGVTKDVFDQLEQVVKARVGELRGSKT